MRCTFLGTSVALLLIALSAPSYAQKWTDFPELRPGQRVGVERVSDGKRFDDVRKCMSSQDSRVGARYFATLVGITASSGSASRRESDASEYAKAQAEAWNLNPEKDILFAVGLRNRSFGLHLGSQWIDLGMRDDALKATVDGSQFNAANRKRDYSWALCSLAQALDFKLFELSGARKGAAEALKERLPKLQEEHKGLGGRIESTPTDSQIRQRYEADSKAIAEKIKAAEESAEKTPEISMKDLDEADVLMAALKVALDVYDSTTARLSDVTKQIDALRKDVADRPDSDWDEPKAALTKLTECEALGVLIRERLDGEVETVRECIATAEVELARGEVRHQFKARTIPFLAFLALMALIAILIAILMISRRRLLKRLLPELESWNTRLQNSEAWLTQLQTDFPEFFAAQSTEWSGQSEELGKETSDAINLAYFLIHKGHEWRGQAKRLAQGGALNLLKVDQAMKILREERVTLEPGDRIRESALDTPMTTGYAGKSGRLLGDLADSVLRAQQLLQESSEWMKAGRKFSERGNTMLYEAQRALAVRHELGLVAHHLESPLQKAAQAFHDLQVALTQNPMLAVSGAFETTLQEVESLHNQIATGNQAIQRLFGELWEQRNNLHAQIEALRSRGLTLKEPGFDAEEDFAALTKMAEKARALMESAQEQKGIATVEDFAAALDEMDSRLQSIGAAPELIPHMVERLDKLKDDIKSDLLTLRIGARNEEEALNELMALQGQTLRLSSELAAATRLAENQRYLQALTKLRNVVQVYDRAIQVVRDLQAKSGADTRASSAKPWPKVWEHAIRFTPPT